MRRHLLGLAMVFCAASAAVAQPCTAEKLVGTWERVSLLRNALSVQPPDAPLFVKFGADGYWSMMEMPPDRPKVEKPLAQQTTKELWGRFERVEGGQGTWFEGEILALVGTGANRSPQARF